MKNHNSHHVEAKVITSLRRLVPNHPLSFDECLRLAERQASELLKLLHVDAAPVPTEAITQLPHIRLRRNRLPVSGLSHWNGERWVIRINPDESPRCQRFTLFHEYKHIIDHGYTDRLYLGDHERTAKEQAEFAANHFAGCALVPTPLLAEAWTQSHHRLHRLADQFDVSLRAIRIRAAEVGLPGARQVPEAVLPSTTSRPPAWNRVAKVARKRRNPQEVVI